MQDLGEELGFENRQGLGNKEVFTRKESAARARNDLL
jgi:hypothetical protein